MVGGGPPLPLPIPLFVFRRDKMKHFFDNIDNYLGYAEEAALAISLFVCMMVLFINVLLRSIFNFILPFPDELARYLMIYIIYLGMSLGFKKGSQLRLDIMINIFPNYKRFFELLADFISLFAAITIVICGYKYTKELFCSNEISSVLEIPLFILYGIAPLTAIFMGFRLTLAIIKNLK